MMYADIVVDNNTNATDYLYTYEAEENELLCIGRKVYVPFGLHSRDCEGYVISVSEIAPEDIPASKLKKISGYDPDVCLSEEAVNTAMWMHTRYLCRYIEAIKCFLPISDIKRKCKDPFDNLELKEEDSKPKDLTDEQSGVLKLVAKNIKDNKHEIVLLKGVTGSGKTEVYLQAMQAAIDSGKQGIVLVPEISLTPMVVARFMSRFGKDSVAVLHSKLTPVQRADQYKRIEDGSAKIVIGARSAIFAPFKNIGLIVLDEEHESSYKSDKSPKYDTLEIATKRAMSNNAVVLLGSATPSVIDYFRAGKGIFKLSEIKNRYNGIDLPKAEIVDMTGEIKAGNRTAFSRDLADAIEEQLKNKKQVILFQNRRGYSSFISCRSCGYVVKCNECGISMPYHKDDGACECHYCGRKVRLPKECPECGSNLIGGYGVGTQQVEELAAKLFPEAKIERLDLDTVKRKGELESTLKRFEKGKTDILIGTQLVAKGLDFDNVGLVGIISADVSLNIPDFRSSERTFQLITQAAGRSGRGDEVGRVIIQTYSPESFAVRSAANHDFESFYNQEIQIRKAAGYPPFSDIFQIMVHDKDNDKAFEYAKQCAEWLRKKVPEDANVLGPAPSVLVRAGGMYRYQILIKAPAGTRKDITLLVKELKDKHEKIKNKAELITIDINPYSFT